MDDGEDENVIRMIFRVMSTTVMKWESTLHEDDLAKFNGETLS